MPHHIEYPLARLSPAKQELLVIDFPREPVVTGTIAPMLEVLSPMAESRENAERLESGLVGVALR